MTRKVLLADYALPTHASALVELLDEYARDPAGGGTALTAHVREHIVGELARRPTAFSVLAFDGDEPVGLVNCFEGFSTFACRPLVNVHDVVVRASHRGQRVASKMLACVEEEARRRGCCKLTLEVLSANASAIRAYERHGFEGYRLAESFGIATFMHKKL